jgi:hypothetical protein
LVTVTNVWIGSVIGFASTRSSAPPHAGAAAINAASNKQGAERREYRIDSAF